MQSTAYIAKLNIFLEKKLETAYVVRVIIICCYFHIARSGPLY